MSPVAVPRSLAGTTIMQLVSALCSRCCNPAPASSSRRKRPPVGEPRPFAGERLGQRTTRAHQAASRAYVWTPAKSALAAALLRLFSMPETGARGRDWVLGHFNADAVAEQRLRFYDEITRRRKARETGAAFATKLEESE